MSSTAPQKQRNLVPVKVRADAVLDSWRVSLFSFEWLDKEGRIRALEDMPLREREKREQAEKLIAQEGFDLPVLGIGLMDNIEIGAGKAIFLTLAARGDKEIDVLIPEGAQKDFSSFLA